MDLQQHVAERDHYPTTKTILEGWKDGCLGYWVNGALEKRRIGEVGTWRRADGAARGRRARGAASSAGEASHGA